MPFRHLCRRLGKALCRSIAQPGESQIAALGGACAALSARRSSASVWIFSTRGQNFVRLAEFAVLDRLLRLRLQGGDFRIVAGLRRRRRLQVLEFSGDLDELRREAFRGNIGFAQNLQRASDLALVEIEPVL